MHRRALLIGLIAWMPFFAAAAEPPVPISVPKVVRFADLHLQLTADARKRIQAKIRCLTRYPKSFQYAVNRTHLFFPIIEQILAAEKVPDDFKYLAVHESTLLGNAVSHTDDVGFWQIQKATALGLKLNVDQQVDERMHLIESTKAAARFLKYHHGYFKSWLGAMLAYNRGRGGAAKVFPKQCYGAKRVRITGETDNYILCVLANKIAFQAVAGKGKHPTLQLFFYNKGHHGKRLGDIATHLKVEEKLLKQHNLWLKAPVVPHTTTCALVVPFLRTQASIPPGLRLTQELPRPAPKTAQPIQPPPSKKESQPALVDYAKRLGRPKTFPAICPAHDVRSVRLIQANGKLAVVARAGDSVASLAQLLQQTPEQFRLANEIDPSHKLRLGQVYYYEAKGSKAAAHYHVVAPGEDLWGIAQTYGIKVAALLEKNRMKAKSPLQEGHILWLRFIRPVHVPVAYQARKQ